VSKGPCSSARTPPPGPLSHTHMAHSHTHSAHVVHTQCVQIDLTRNWRRGCRRTSAKPFRGGLPSPRSGVSRGRNGVRSIPGAPQPIKARDIDAVGFAGEQSSLPVPPLTPSWAILPRTPPGTHTTEGASCLHCIRRAIAPAGRGLRHCTEGCTVHCALCTAVREHSLTHSLPGQAVPSQPT
jgi:hypothetical protein